MSTDQGLQREVKALKAKLVKSDKLSTGLAKRLDKIDKEKAVKAEEAEQTRQAWENAVAADEAQAPARQPGAGTIDILLKTKQSAARKLQGRLNFQGLEVSIENRKGGVRKGVDSDGTKWRTKMKHPYGYIKGTVGSDGDHVDCFIGPDKEAATAYVVHIKDPKTGKYDEDKVMLGYKSREFAEKAYRMHYDDPDKYLISISTISMKKLHERFEHDKDNGQRTTMLKAAEEAFITGFLDIIEKRAGAGTMAASMLIPASVMATLGGTVGALADNEHRGRGALIGAGIGAAAGAGGGYHIGKSIPGLKAKAKDFAYDVGQSLSDGMTSNVDDVLNKAKDIPRGAFWDLFKWKKKT